MNELQFNAVISELIEENPFALRAVLRILEVEFTTRVPTLAVTCEDKPRLLVNLEFVRENCFRDDHVKAVLCHEFLHVLLRHTEKKLPFSRARHIAFDAVINAIIHRQYGVTYSSMMAKYYAKASGLLKLLRPMNREEAIAYNSNLSSVPAWVRAWGDLYKGNLNADDIASLASDLGTSLLLSVKLKGSLVLSGGGSKDSILPGGGMGLNVGDRDGNRADDDDGDDNGNSGDDSDGGGGGNGDGNGDGSFVLVDDGGEGFDGLLGGHEELEKEASQALRDALKQSLKEMNGSGIWRLPKSQGVGANPYETLITQIDEPMARWRRATLAVLKRHLQPDPKSRARKPVLSEYRIPVLSSRDRRAFLKSSWSTFLPDACWIEDIVKRDGTAQVYLDVSGSMNAEMPQIIALLARLSRYIRRPFWAFSDEVAPAVIERGQLKAMTSGGTSLSSVLRHIAKTRPSAAVVVTDGYIEKLDKSLLKNITGTSLHIILSRDGNPAALHSLGLSYTQLEKRPQ
ncbi:MAG: hypothetical protein HQM09_17605 [Candidatus Riflebacteria bacterium]|nr:hypothetical protein [Candidatus Riflebacteria bacterium]